MSCIIPEVVDRQEIYEMLASLPDNESMYKCHSCNTVFDIYSGGIPVLMSLIPKDEICCPACGTNKVELMCKVDGYSIYLKLKGFNCRQDIMINGADICPVCRTAMCPECYNHSVVSWSRITGYLNDITGWNEGKKQELTDRKRYVI